MLSYRGTVGFSIYHNGVVIQAPPLPVASAAEELLKPAPEPLYSLKHRPARLFAHLQGFAASGRPCLARLEECLRSSKNLIPHSLGDEPFHCRYKGLWVANVASYRNFQFNALSPLQEGHHRLEREAGDPEVLVPRGQKSSRWRTSRFCALSR